MVPGPGTGGLFSVAGRKAVVTGGRRGLGRGMALGLLAAGAKVTVIARSADPGDLPQAAGANAANLHYLTADLADPVQRAGLLARADECMGGLDILVNNAGIQRRMDAVEYTRDAWQEDLEILLTAVMDLSQQAARLMLPRGRGSIIQIGSISGFQGARRISGYATAKHGLVGLTRCLANEWAAAGINVNSIAPGLFETDMAAHVMEDQRKRAEMQGRIPSGRFGVPDDLVGPLLFLASDASRHVHGHTLPVDGGWLGR